MREENRAVIQGSYMEVGDVATYDLDTDDKFVRVQVAALRNGRQVIGRNSRLSKFLSPRVKLDTLPSYVFFPPALSGGISNARLAHGVKSGGRTLILDRSAEQLLGIPMSVYLDLDKLGWGNGRLELRAEIKGAGSDFVRTLVSPSRLASVLKRYSFLANTCRSFLRSKQNGALFSSLALFEERNVGGQELSYGRHSVRVSHALLGRSRIKFVPTWLCVAQPREFLRNLAIVSRAMPPTTPRYEKRMVTEIRFSPGSVRGVYFENARSETELAALCCRVSQDPYEVEESLWAMIEDARHYLELLATSTTRNHLGRYFWDKVGDISLEFRLDEQGHPRRAWEYKNVKRRAWYLAKDEIVVRRLGKFFSDMESFRARPSRYAARNENELLFQHDLFVLNVIRDHLRVCTQVAIGIEAQRKKRASDRRKRLLQQLILLRMVNAVNESAYVRLRIQMNFVHVAVYYPHLKRTYCYEFLRTEIAERYL